MDAQTARQMSALTTEFYRRVSASFSATRQTPWAGWERLLQLVGDRESMSVLDVACGNLRFERFLGEHVRHVDAWAYDNCDELVGDVRGVARFSHLDLSAALFDNSLAQTIDAAPCDLCVSFGFMHHLPLFGQRLGLLQALVAHARPGGLVAVSFWQLENDERLCAKARPVEGGDEHDHLLGWQHERGVLRYCRHVTDDEIDQLVGGLAGSAHEVERYSADGRTGDLNRYLVLNVP